MNENRPREAGASMDPNDDSTQWTPQRHALWQRLRDYRFGGEQAEAFVRRIAHTCGSDRQTALDALEEYRRFCFIAVAAGHAATPSEIVDKVWHVHMTDTRDYWQRFCPQVLEQPLHHAPSLGGTDEDARHREQYRDTYASYRSFFDDPPARFWSPPHPPEPTVDKTVTALPLSRLRSPWYDEPKGNGPRVVVWTTLSLMAMALGTANNRTLDALDWTGGWFLILYAALIGLAWTAGNACQRATRGPNRRAATVPADPIEVAFLAGGAPRAADVALVELLARDAITLDYSGEARHVVSSNLPVWLRSGAGESGLPPGLRDIAQAARQRQRLTETLSALAAHYSALAEPMQRKGLWISARRDWFGRWVAALPMAALVVLGSAKISIGQARERPVGFLVVLVSLAALLVLVQLLSGQRRSRAGEWALHDATRKAGYSGNVAERVAVAGTIALEGTALADYHTLRTPAPSSGSSDSSGGSSCSGGGGDGGGGGGGCGGCGGGGGGD